MNREICGQCGQSLDPNWIDERIPKLESMLCEAIRERDSLRAHLHDEHQRHVGTMDERDTALDDLAAARALLGEVREWIPYYRWIPDLRERVDAIIGKKTP